jgi:hypothetical protein
VNDVYFNYFKRKGQGGKKGEGWRQDGQIKTMGNKYGRNEGKKIRILHNKL